jgi:hypothetical protein
MRRQAASRTARLDEDDQLSVRVWADPEHSDRELVELEQILEAARAEGVGLLELAAMLRSLLRAGAELLLANLDSGEAVMVRMPRDWPELR